MIRRAIRIAGLAAVGWLVTSQVLALVLMARFVASNDTPGGFGRPLGQYLAAAGRAVDAVNDGDAAEVLIVGQGDLPATDATPAIFDILLRGRAAYRFVDGSSTAVFPPHPAVALIEPHSGDGAAQYDLWPAVELPGGYRLVTLDASWPSANLEPFHGPRTFENGVELQGYRWQGSAAPAGEIDVWLLWQVLWPSSDDSHFSVQLLNDEKQRIGQQDTEGYPTIYRKKGDRILSKFAINISDQAVPGPYQARMGIYLYPQVANLSILDGAGNPVGEAVLTDLVIEGFHE